MKIMKVCDGRIASSEKLIWLYQRHENIVSAQVGIGAMSLGVAQEALDIVIMHTKSVSNVTNFWPMSMEGLSLGISSKIGFPHKYEDHRRLYCGGDGHYSISLFLHRLDGIQEDTVITAIITGKVIEMIKKSLYLIIQKMCL